MNVTPPVPDPSRANTPDELVAELGRLRIWAGKPSYRRLRELGGRRSSVGGHQVNALPTTTTWEILSGRRLPQLPRLDFVQPFVAACLRFRDVPEQQIERHLEDWRAAWHRIAERPAGTDPLETTERPLGDGSPKTRSTEAEPSDAGIAASETGAVAATADSGNSSDGSGGADDSAGSDGFVGSDHSGGSGPPCGEPIDAAPRPTSTTSGRFRRRRALRPALFAVLGLTGLVLLISALWILAPGTTGAPTASTERPEATGAGTEQRNVGDQNNDRNNGENAGDGGPGDEDSELIVNGDFEGTTEPWWKHEGVRLDVDRDGLHADVRGGTEHPWDRLVGQSGIDLRAGRPYLLAFDAAGTSGQVLQVTVQLEEPPYTATLRREVVLTEEPRHHEFRFESSLRTRMAQVTLQLGGHRQDFEARFANMSLTELD